MSMIGRDTTPTDPKLLKRMQELAKRRLSEEEREAQRVSFILAGLPEGSRISRSKIAEFVKTR